MSRNLSIPIIIFSILITFSIIAIPVTDVVLHAYSISEVSNVAKVKITHIITTTVGENGKLKPKGEVKVRDGKNKLFKATPKKGYKAIIKVDGQIVKTGKVGKPCTYKLKNVVADMTLEALFEKGTTANSNSISIAIIGLGESIKVTNTTPATFAGYADSGIGISKVEFFNDTTGTSGTATGTTEWSAAIALKEGDNTLRFVATAKDKTTSEISTIVTYYPDLDFTTALSLSSDTVYIGESEDVTFTIGLGNTTDAVVKLYQTDENGENPVELGEMKDDGTLPDEIQGDGVFTLLQTISSIDEGHLYYRVGVTKGEKSYFSETASIWATQHFSSEQVQTAVSTADSAKEIYDTAISESKTLEEAAKEVKQSLSNDPNIGATDTTGVGGVWWITNDGILGLYHPTIDGEKSGSSQDGNRSVQAKASQQPVQNTQLEVFYYPASYLQDRSQYVPNYLSNKTGLEKSSKMTAAATETKNEIKSKKGLLISPYINNPNTTSNFGNGDDYYVPWKTIKDKKSCALSASAEILNNGSVNVTIDSFKNLSDYGYIHISTHGDNFFAGLLGLWQEAWGPNDFLKGALSQVVILTGLKIPKNADGTFDITGYENDIKAKRIAISPSGTVSLLPKFFSDYLTQLPNSLVVLSACRSMYNNSMANAFLSKGAGGVVGYSDYVATSYAQNTLNKIINDMFDNKTLAQGVADAISTYGSNDADKDPAYLYYAGSGDLLLPSGDLENAGFEDGVLTPWSKEGDGRIITQLGGTSPTEGSYMGIVSTGLGYTTQSGSIEQEFCASPKLSKLSFDWNFFSEEFKEYCNSQYQDAFVVSISVYDEATDTWTETELFKRIVDDLCGSVSKSDVGFDRGDVYNTGWNTNQEIDVSAYVGKHLRLKFYATDVGDSIYDTAILVDNIVLTDAP